MPRALYRFSELLTNKLDLAFTLGRVFGLLPVMIMSRQIADATLLAERVSNYQVSMFLATLVLYGAPQVYLVKRGVERRVFVWHMAISSSVLAAGLCLLELLRWSNELIMPFIFLVFFRSYYLLFATYLKTERSSASYTLIAIALIALSVFGFTQSYVASTAVCLVLIGAFTMWAGYSQIRYLGVAFRNYFTLLRRNAGYFFTFLLQQTYTQITLAVYAVFASGSEYLLATHIVYIYAISFIFHGILFRYYTSKMSEEGGVDTLRVTLRICIRSSLLLGGVLAGMVVLFHGFIEEILFSRRYLTFPTTMMLGAMILLNSVNFGWSALFLSARRPMLLSTVAAVSTAVVILGMGGAAAMGVANGLLYAMLAGLLVQAVLRSTLGMRLLRERAGLA